MKFHSFPHRRTVTLCVLHRFLELIHDGDHLLAAELINNEFAQISDCNTAPIAMWKWPKFCKMLYDKHRDRDRNGNANSNAEIKLKRKRLAQNIDALLNGSRSPVNHSMLGIVDQHIKCHRIHSKHFNLRSKHFALSQSLQNHKVMLSLFFSIFCDFSDFPFFDFFVFPKHRNKMPFCRNETIFCAKNI